MSFQRRFDGTITIAEDQTPGWDLSAVTCTPGGTPRLAADGSLTGEVDVDATAGNTVACDFTNVERGAIRVLQAVTPNGDPQVFDFQLGGGPDALAASFGLAGGSPAFDLPRW